MKNIMAEFDFDIAELSEVLAKSKSMYLNLSQCQEIMTNKISEELEIELSGNFKQVVLNNAPEEIISDLETELNSNNSGLVKNYFQDLKNQVFFNFVEIQRNLGLTQTHQ